MRLPIVEPSPRWSAAIARLSDRRFGVILTAVLAPLALAIHGYHPYSEDGGLYVAGIKRLLHPEFYAASAPFVDAHLRYSLFAPLVAALVRTSHLSLPAVLLLVYLVSLWATLYAFWLIAEQALTTRAARAGAVLLLTLWLTIPIAGTSLILMDPYVTARSLSLPCTLFALYGVFTRRLAYGAIVTFISLLLAALMHPLMAAYALGGTLLLISLFSPRRNVRRYGTLILCLATIASAALIQVTAPSEPAAYLPIALSRYYWFLSRWQWYELLGLVAPLAIVSAALHKGSMQPLARMAAAAGTTALLIALLFSHAHADTHLVARLQPLRVFQLVYLVMILILGELIGEYVLKARFWRWFAFTTFIGGIFFAVQRATYSDTAHIEWPNAAPINPYEQAFLWISRNTPVDALFALDPHYISAPGEDAQCFRALAERSALPDYSKDGGEASITPSLSAAWTAGQQAQTGLNRHTDSERLSALRPLNVTWIILPHEAQTAFICRFHNARVQVCKLP